MKRVSTGSNLTAVIWVLAGTALFSLIFASGKFAGDTASTCQILFLRYIGGAATLLTVIALRREAVTIYRSRNPSSHFLRAAVGASGGLALIYASAEMPIVDATAIGLLYVVFVVPLGMLVFKERISRQHLAGIGLCCAGAALMMISRGAFTKFTPAYTWPAAIAVLGAVLLAVEGLLIKLLSRADRALTILLYVNGFGVLLMVVPAIMTWKAISLAGALPFLLLGPIAITAQYCIVQGYRQASLSIVGPVDYTWLVFAGLIGFLFFGEVPTWGAVIGSIIIAAGGIVLAIIKPSVAENS